MDARHGGHLVEKRDDEPEAVLDGRGAPRRLQAEQCRPQLRVSADRVVAVAMLVMLVEVAVVMLLVAVAVMGWRWWWGGGRLKLHLVLVLAHGCLQGLALLCHRAGGIWTQPGGHQG